MYYCRETILRLVSEAKKQESLAAQLSEIHQVAIPVQMCNAEHCACRHCFCLTGQTKMEQEALLATLQRERDSYQERLLAAKETMAAQEQEIQAKESRCSAADQH